MATLTEDPTTANSDSNPSPAPAVPNFREDERVLARYATMLERRKKTFFVEHESSVRRNASTKRDELQEALDAAQAEWDKRKELADQTREAYRAAYPHHVKKLRLVEPSGLENLRSLGAANKLYHAAEEAWRAAEAATSTIRKLEHNETQLDVELEKALERAPEIAKDVTESEDWLNEIHAEEEMAAVKAKVDAIEAERADYAERLANGRVSQQELRLRAFAQEDIKPLPLPAAGLIFYRIDAFGPEAFFILRDARKALFALPYDHRLESLLGGVYDINRNGKEFVVARTLQSNGRIPMTVLEHFTKCDGPDGEAIQAAYKRHQEFAKEPRGYATLNEGNANEAAAIELFAAFAAAAAAK
jgi:hypothetical protein